MLRVEQRVWSQPEGWSPVGAPPSQAQLVLVFGAATGPGGALALGALREAYPEALVLGCSTADAIVGVSLMRGGLVATAVHFEHTAVRAAQAPLERSEDSATAGQALARALEGPGLRHVFVVSDGLSTNGSALVEGLQAQLPPGVGVTGGLAGDGARFERTFVWASMAAPAERCAAAVGLYGAQLQVGHGSAGGWRAFGAERRVTQARGNVVLTLDDQRALELYERYLGEHARDLPASGLLFPLLLRTPGEEPVVRTLLGVDRAAGGLRFAGDVPQGSTVQLMNATADRLLDGAMLAASHSRARLATPQLALLVSCFGRSLVLKRRLEDELEAVQDSLGSGVPLAGFYAYGELGPSGAAGRCALHNQTMTVTTFSEP